MSHSSIVEDIEKDFVTFVSSRHPTKKTATADLSRKRKMTGENWDAMYDRDIRMGTKKRRSNFEMLVHRRVMEMLNHSVVK